MALATESEFREHFPEFKSPTKYTSEQVTYWLGIADMMLVNPLRWATMRNNGIELFTAHNLVLEYQAQKASASGAVPGIQTGAVSGKTIGPVSVSYDSAAGLELNGGHWNLTNYGTRFLRLARMIGAGPVQV
jgi:hypothetical protein